MTKVFRPFNIQKSNALHDWQESEVYGTEAINQIKDPEGAIPTKEITSIPSPFARIDLVKTAFKEVVDAVRRATTDPYSLSADKMRDVLTRGGGKQPSIYHKLVSETFDVAEIFFNFDRYREMFEIITWDRQENNPTCCFNNTLNLFLKSDAEGSDPYNFKKLNRFYLLNYIGPGRPAEMNIVGATSPATLFISSANDLSYVSKNISFRNDRPFDDNYQPLFARDFELQKYFFTFRKKYDGFSRDFEELDDYLNFTYHCLSYEQKREVDNIDVEQALDDYQNIRIDGGNDVLEILGDTFHQRSKSIKWKSDFEISSNIFNGEQPPLVLPVESGNLYADFIYTTDKWGVDNKAEYFDCKDWKHRRLPIVHEEYPYLTISDFLTDVIIKTPYELNSDCFYNGGYVSSKEHIEKYSFLLPLSELFFDFFTPQDLIKAQKNGKKMLEIVDCNVEGDVKVTLRIPVKKGHVEYTRLYSTSGGDREKNIGTIVEAELGLGIMPLVDFPQNVSKEYRVAFYNSSRFDISLSYRNGKDSVKSHNVVRLKKDLEAHGGSHESYQITENIDSIKVDLGIDVSGFICPIFKSVSDSNEKFTFAVDFGTTNTHIEYCTDQNPTPVPFNISAEEKQLVKMHMKYTSMDIKMGFEQDFIPETIGDKDLHSFPIRTVYVTKKDVKYGTAIPFCDGNIPFLYEKEKIPQWDRVITNLKWEDNYGLLKLHIETIFIMLRNKVILNGGRLSDTKILWFYPASMTAHKVASFARMRKDAYEKYFGPDADQNVISISESKAPYLHFKTSQGATPNVVTIDVGGGTTDVFVVEDHKDKMLMSFRFASNAIFGDGYNSNPSQNGFVCKYINAIRKDLEKFAELKDSLRQIEAMQKSPDIIAFLFSLQGEKVKNNRELDFLRKLIDDDKMRYVFIIFYGAIVYYVARVMKAKGLKKPTTIAFSGNGAKTLTILSCESDIQSNFFKLIFDGVYEDETGKIKVQMEKNPKIATCKGGIEDPTPQSYNDINAIKSVFPGDGFECDSNQPITYRDITDEMKASVENSVKTFLEFLFDLHKNNQDYLVNTLGADSSIYSKVKEFCLGVDGIQALNVSMSEGFNNKNKEVTDETTVLEETLFFYPLIGFLHDLAFYISKQ